MGWRIRETTGEEWLLMVSEEMRRGVKKGEMRRRMTRVLWGEEGWGRTEGQINRN